MGSDRPIGHRQRQPGAPLLPRQAGRGAAARRESNGGRATLRAALVVAAVGLCALGVLPSPHASAAQRASPAPVPLRIPPERAGDAAPESLVDETVLDDVRERRAEAFRHDDFYAYRERRTYINTNPFGRLGTGDVKLYEVYPSPTQDLTYRRLVAANGEPTSAAELAKQDRDYHTRAAEVRRRLAEEAAARLQGTPEEQAEARSQRAEELTRSRERAREQIDDVINATQFDVKRREIFEGRPAIVLTFQPRPGANPQTRRGDLARKFAGTAWIDEADREVRYVEATSVDSISFGLGLAARISDGAKATMRREEVADGVWMLTSVTLTGRGRALLFLRGLSLDYSVEWFDYRPADEVSIPGAP